MIASLKKAFKEYGKNPFGFVCGSLLYMFMQLCFLLGAVGLFVIFFFFASALSLSVSVRSMGITLAIGIIAVLLLFFMSGLNAALMKAYANALEGGKSSLREFFEYALKKSVMFFALLLIRDIAALLAIGPVVFAWAKYLSRIPYSEVVIVLYSAGMLFMLHMLFTPSLLSAGVLGTTFIQSLKNGLAFLKRKHVFFVMLYALFAFAWLLNFIPLVQLVSIFVLYPVIYSAMIAMFINIGEAKSETKTKKKEE